MRKNILNAVLFLSIFFAATGTTAWSENTPPQVNKPLFVGEVFGQQVTKEEFDFAYKSSAIFSINPQEPRTDGERRQETWKNIVFLKEADAEKIEISKDELQKELSRLLSEKNITFGSYNYFQWIDENFKEDHAIFEKRIENLLKVKKLISKIMTSPPPDIKKEGVKQNVIQDIIKRANMKDYEMDKVLIFETNQGSFEVQLYTQIAPKTCENIMKLAEKKYYDGLIFHRVIKGFMIQGGDPTGTGSGGESIWGKPFEDEVSDQVQFEKAGILAMANSGPHTNGSQFFITLAPTPHLNKKHTIFGEVISGFEIVHKIGETPADKNDRPLTDQKIIHLTVKKWQ